MGGLNLRRNTNLKVLLSVLFPPAMLQLEFRTQEELRQMPQTEEEYMMEHCEDEEDGSDEEDEEQTGADEVGWGGGERGSGSGLMSVQHEGENCVVACDEFYLGLWMLCCLIKNGPGCQLPKQHPLSCNWK